MSKFRAAPKLQQSEDAFIKGAELPRTAKAPTVQSAPKAVPVAVIAPATPATPAAPVVRAVATPAPETGEHPWTMHDPGAKQVATTQPLRLNAYQHEQLKWLAESQDRSLAQVLRRLIAPALEQAVRDNQ